MSYSLYNSNTYRNIYNNNNNINQIERKNQSFSPPPSSQLNSAGRIASTPINYHYLQKEKEREKERKEQNLNQNEINSQKNKGFIMNSFVANYKPNSITNVNTYRKNENNKNNNDLFNYNNNINNNNSNNSSYYQNNYLRRNYHNNNYLNRNNQENKEIKLQSNLITQNKTENEKTQKAKALMDDFDKKLYDTVSNFGPKKFNNDEKMKNYENEKEGPREPTPNLNLNSNYRKRNFSYDKFNLNNTNSNSNLNINNNNNNLNQNYQRSTLHNTDTLYRNYFGNNVNIHPINQKEFNVNNYLNYNNYNGKDNLNYRNQKNSVDKVMLNRYQTPNYFRKTPNKEEFRNINQTQKNYYLKNYSSYTLGGTDAFKRPKTNQDSYLTKEDDKNFIFGVFDGHGFEGHLVSQAIKNYLNNNLNSSTFSSNENIYTIFKSLSSSINSSSNFNAMESGSTVVLTFISNNLIICANCGDSRAILISENENKIIALSRDHKPELPEEKKRILESGGRVDQIYGMGPFRVWFKDAEYPGLAMSRSIGDGYAHKVGVIDEPEILVFRIEDIKPKAIILGSDGVFEFMKNEEIKNIVAKYFYSMDSQGCAKEIVEGSRKIWENSGYAIDDITCVVGFFDS